MNPHYYNAKAVPIRCDCGRPPEILRAGDLAKVTQRLNGWRPEWNRNVQYLALCSGGVCGWSEFTASPDHGMFQFLNIAYKSGAVDAAIKEHHREQHARREREKP